MTPDSIIASGLRTERWKTHPEFIMVFHLISFLCFLPFILCSFSLFFSFPLSLQQKYAVGILSIRNACVGPAVWLNRLSLSLGHWFSIWTMVHILFTPLLIQLLCYNLGKRWKMARDLGPSHPRVRVRRTSPSLALDELSSGFWGLSGIESADRRCHFARSHLYVSLPFKNRYIFFLIF